jgi:hypothetical protein
VWNRPARNNREKNEILTVSDEILLGAQVSLRRPHRGVPQEQLDLFQLPTGL